MTKSVTKTFACPVCEKSEQRTVRGSRAPLRHPDLDTRGTRTWMVAVEGMVEQCSHCGFAARKLEDRTDLDIEWLRREISSAPYQAILARRDLAAGPHRMLAYAYLCQQRGMLAEAGWATLWAAWCYDNNNDETNATVFRRLAASHFSKAIELGQRLIPLGENERQTDNADVSTYQETDRRFTAKERVVMADIYRRCGEFSLAIEHGVAGLEDYQDEQTRSFLIHEIALARLSLRGCCNVWEVAEQIPPGVEGRAISSMGIGCFLTLVVLIATPLLLSVDSRLAALPLVIFLTSIVSSAWIHHVRIPRASATLRREIAVVSSNFSSHEKALM